MAQAWDDGVKNKSEKRVTSVAVFGSIVRVIASMLAGIVIALLAGGIFFLNLQPDLSVWHTAELGEGLGAHRFGRGKGCSEKQKEPVY